MRPLVWAPIATLVLFASFACFHPEGTEGGDCHPSHSCNRDDYCDGDLVCSNGTCEKGPPIPPYVPPPPTPHCAPGYRGACGGDESIETVQCVGGATPITSDFWQCTPASDAGTTYCCTTNATCRQTDVSGCLDAGIGYRCGHLGSPAGDALRCEPFQTGEDDSHTFCCTSGDGCFRFDDPWSSACSSDEDQYRCFGDAGPPGSADAGCRSGHAAPEVDGSAPPTVVCCPRHVEDPQSSTRKP